MELKGIIPILQTPFSADGMEVDYEDLQKETDLLIREGVNGLALFGVATEFFKLSDSEKEKMVAAVVEAADHRVPVIASITRNSTELAVKDAVIFKEIGVDALMTFAPHFIKPSTAALQKHIVTVASSVDLPFIIQYTPNLGGAELKEETILSIKNAIPNSLHIKAECNPPAPFVEKLRQRIPNGIGIFCGNGGLQMLDLFDRGVNGIMPGCSMASAFVRFYQLYTAGEREKAVKIAELISLMVLLQNQQEEMYIRYEKVVLKERGVFKSDICRAPTGYSIDPKILAAFLAYREQLMNLVS